jgi:hypothetical protein
MARLDTNRQMELEPKRMEYAIAEIQKLGYIVTQQGSTQLTFQFKGHTVHFFPYSGWHSGASIKDGRGLKELLLQIKS